MTVKIGVMSMASPSLPLEELATWDSDSGFERLEIACCSGEGWEVLD
jgi:hypothetical protein